MKKFFFILFIFTIGIAEAQTDTVYTYKYISESTRFAWTTFGGDILALGNGSSSFSDQGTDQKINFNSTFVPRLTIGGIHFWGHSDFYVTFPLSFLSIQQKSREFKALNYRQGIETGIKLYPLALKSGRISPYIGVSFRLLSFEQQLEGITYNNGGSEWQKMIYPLQTGISYTSDKFIFTAGVSYQNLQEITDYFVDPDVVGQIELSPVSVQLGLTRYIDTDKSMRNESSVRQENLKYEILEKENHLSSWYWGLGPSAGLQISKSPYLEANFPHLSDNFIGGFMPDITFGRFFNKTDMNVGLSYRTLSSNLEAFDDKIRIRRHSFMLESYKNLFNWLGFVPFAGITGSIENLSVHVNGVNYQKTKPAIGFIVGWDIRVTKTGTSLLRTNLRWIPELYTTIDNQKMMFNHLEFNFIQWVQFIGRKKTYSKYQ